MIIWNLQYLVAICTPTVDEQVKTTNLQIKLQRTCNISAPAFKAIRFFSKDNTTKSKLNYIPMFLVDQDEVRITRYGYVFGYCYEPDLDINSANDVGIMHFVEGANFTNNILTQQFPFWLILSSGVYSSAFQSQNGEIEYFYMNQKMQNTLLWIYEGDIIRQHFRNPAGNSALYEQVDLSKDQVFDASLPRAPFPEVIGAMKFQTALYFCDQSKRLCKFESTPQIIQKTDPIRYIVASRSVYFGVEFDALNAIEPVTRTISINDIQLYRNFSYREDQVFDGCIQLRAKTPRSVEYPRQSGKYLHINTRVRSPGENLDTYVSPKICNGTNSFNPSFLLVNTDEELSTVCKQIFSSSEENEVDQQLSQFCQESFYSNADFALISLNSQLLVFIVECYLFFSNQTETNKQIRGMRWWQLVLTIISGLHFISEVVMILVLNESQICQPMFFVTLFTLVGFICERFGSMYLHTDQESSDDETEIISSSQKCQFVLMFIISFITGILGILLMFPDVIQVMDFFKIRYPKDYVDSISWLLYVPNLIIETISGLKDSFYPIMFYLISVVNQQIFMSKIFGSLFKNNKGMNWVGFAVKQLFVLFGYYQNFVCILVFDTLNYLLSHNINLNNYVAVTIQLVVCFSLFAFTKYNMLLNYYLIIQSTLLRCIVQIFQLPFIIIYNVVILIQFCFKKVSKQKYVATILVSLIHVYDLIIICPFMILYPFFTTLGDFDCHSHFVLQLFGIIPEQQNYVPVYYQVMYRMQNQNKVTKVDVKELLASAFSTAAFGSFMMNLMLINNSNYMQNFVFIVAFFFVVLFFMITAPFCKYLYQLEQVLLFDLSKDENSKITDFLNIKQSFHVDTQLNSNYEHEAEWFSEVKLQFINGGFGYIPAIGPLLSTIAQVFNQPSFLKGRQFGGWLEFVLNLLLISTALGSIYAALMNQIVLFWISFVVFALTSFKNTQSDSMNFGPKFGCHCQKSKLHSSEEIKIVLNSTNQLLSASNQLNVDSTTTGSAALKQSSDQKIDFQRTPAY